MLPHSLEVYRNNADTKALTRIFLVFAAAAVMGGCLGGGGGDGGGSTGIAPAPPSGNSVPAISGSPPTATTVSSSYVFTPAATDADGDTLTFSIRNKPAWADFDDSSGRLSGTPDGGDVGSYSGIVISVSDGSATASLPSFSIVVSQIGTGSVTLSWTAPTQNDDGTALTDLAGYKIYYGQNSGVYTNTQDINNPGLTSFVVENLTLGEYFFVATAYNSAGIESRRSNEASKIVQ